MAGGGDGAVGASLAYNYLGGDPNDPSSSKTNKLLAYIAGSTGIVSAHTIAVNASEASSIDGYTVAGSGSGDFSLGGAVTINFLRDDVQAFITLSTQVAGANGVSVTASDPASIEGFAGQLSIAGTVAIGVSGAYDDIANVIQAYIGTDPNGIVSNLAGAGAGAATVSSSAGDVVVEVTSTSRITGQGAGVTGSGTVAAAGSAVIAMIGDKINAFLSGATVNAGGNVLVQANSDDSVNSFGGEVSVSDIVTVGGSAVVDILTTTTQAYLLNSTVSALGQDSAIRVEHWDTDTGGTENDEALNGLGVVASNTVEITSYAITANISIPNGDGDTSVGVNLAVNKVDDQTRAYISGSNVGTSASKVNQVAVNAHQSTTIGSSGGVFGLGDVAIAATVDTDLLGNTTQAYVSASKVEAAAGGVAMAVVTRETIDSTTAGAAVGTYAGLSGAASGINSANTAQAWIGDQSTVQTTGSLEVDADDRVTITPIDGVGAASAAFAGGGAVAVALLGETTTADITDSTTDATGETQVEANSYEAINPAAATGAVSLNDAVGFTASVEMTQGTTAASINDSRVNQASKFQGTSQSVIVDANDSVSQADGLGAAAIGFQSGGIGAGVDVIVIENAVDAHVADDSQVSASGGRVDVVAAGDKSVTSVVVSLAGGSDYAVDGSVSVAGIGMGLSKSARGEISGSIKGSVDGSINDSGGAGGLVTTSNANVNGNSGSGSTVSNTTAANAQAGSASSGQSIDGALSGTKSEALSNEWTGRSGADLAALKASSQDASSAPSDVTAYVGSGSTVDGSAGVNVTANDTVQVLLIVGAAGGSGGLSAGGSVGIVNIGDATQAFVDGGSTVEAGSGQAINVKATFNDQQMGGVPTVNAYAGQVGLVGLGAQVAEVTDASVQRAFVGDYSPDGRATNTVALDGTGAVTVAATANRAFDAQAAGGSAGLIAAGASIAQATSDGSTTASASARTSTTAASIAVTATSTDVATSNALAVAGGIGAGTGNTATSTISPTVQAIVAGSSNIGASGAITVNARETPTASATSLGIAVGAIGVGASIANASDAATVAAILGQAAQFSVASSLTVAANQLPTGDLPSVYADAVAGTGGILAGVNAAEATTSAGGSVTATVGQDVGLPSGDVSLAALSQTYQSAVATGVVAGVLAAGAAIAQATSGVTTSAELGADATTSVSRSGALSVIAGGQDQNSASAVAGSGGLIAGDAAIGTTGDTSSVNARIDGGKIYAGDVTVEATNTSLYDPSADSTNAAVLGGSGADAETNDGSSKAPMSAASSIGDNTTITATGLVTVSSQDVFNQANSGTSAAAAAGGLLSGSAALSNATLDGSSSATLGDHVTITSGTDPIADPGGIVVVASTVLITDDRITLITGGTIQVAAASSTITADITNSATLGTGDKLTSDGNIGVGTYSTVNASSSAEVTTYGLAAVGITSSTVDVTSNQSVNIGTDDALTAFGNVNLMAGQDPTGLFTTSLLSLASAQGYVRGLIAVPTASAASDLASGATLTINPGATVESGQNADVGAFPGSPNAVVDGTGHGYELGFIPVEDGTSTPKTSAASKVVQDGTIIAGIYHELTITIPDDQGKGYTSTLTINPDQQIAAPLSVAYDPFFDVQGYIKGETASGSDARQVAETGVSSTPVGTFTLGSLYASGGVATINADTLSGDGSVTAYGGPKITVDNESPDYLILGTVTIPNIAGGNVLFTGKADLGAAQSAGITVSQVNPGKPGSVSIDNSYEGASGTTAGHYGPALILTDVVSNLGGLVSFTDEAGSFLQIANATVLAAQQTTYAPNGVAVVDVNGVYYPGSNPYSQWQDYMIYPGGMQSFENSDDAAAAVEQAVALVANYEVEQAALFPSSAQPVLADRTDYTNPYGGAKSGTQDELNQILYGHAGNKDDNASYVYYGSDIPWEDSPPYHDGSYQTAVEESLVTPTGEAYSISDYSEEKAGGQPQHDDGWFPVIPLETLEETASSFAQASAPTQSGADFGNQVVIDANTLDINAPINAGGTTNWSISLSSSLDSLFGLYQIYYNQGIFTNSIFSFPLRTVNAGDGQIQASFNAITGKVVLDDVARGLRRRERQPRRRDHQHRHPGRDQRLRRPRPRRHREPVRLSHRGAGHLRRDRLGRRPGRQQGRHHQHPGAEFHAADPLRLRRGPADQGLLGARRRGPRPGRLFLHHPGRLLGRVQPPDQRALVLDRDGRGHPGSRLHLPRRPRRLHLLGLDLELSRRLAQ